MIELKADLHTHTTLSDGTLTPHELLLLAKESGISALSITDHDTIAAYPEALLFAKSIGIEMIPGVELSCLQGQENVHILGYAFDPTSTVLLESTAIQRERRIDRNRRILQKLKTKSMFLEESDISDSTHPTNAYGRVHIAQALVKKGYVETVPDAFKQFIGNDKSCYVEGTKWTVDEGIALIREAKGKVVIAHPHLINSKSAIRELLRKPFDGVEVYYGRWFTQASESWLNIAKDKGWFVTGGSDFHGAVKPDIKLGCSYAPYEVFLQLQQHFHWHCNGL